MAAVSLGPIEGIRKAENFKNKKKNKTMIVAR